VRSPDTANYIWQAPGLGAGRRRFTSISFCCTLSGSAISTSAYRLWINTRSTCTSPLADSDVLRVTSGAVWIRMSPPSGCRSARGYALLFAWKTSGRNNPRMQRVLSSRRSRLIPASVAMQLIKPEIVWAQQDRRSAQMICRLDSMNRKNYVPLRKLMSTPMPT
jgi:hypothetical protein